MYYRLKHFGFVSITRFSILSKGDYLWLEIFSRYNRIFSTMIINFESLGRLVFLSCLVLFFVKTAGEHKERERERERKKL